MNLNKMKASRRLKMQGAEVVKIDYYGQSSKAMKSAQEKWRIREEWVKTCQGWFLTEGKMRPGVMFGLVQRRDSRYRKMKTTEKVGWAAEVWCDRGGWGRWWVWGKWSPKGSGWKKKTWVHSLVPKELMCGCTVSLVSDFNVHELNAVGSQTTLNGRWSLQSKWRRYFFPAQK